MPLSPSNSAPVNKTAARVVSKGTHYVPDKKINQTLESAPITFVRPDQIKDNSLLKNPKFVDLCDQRRGRLTVLGLKKGSGSVWVCRCDCGMFVTRKSKAIRNPANDQDRCDECRQLAYLKRNELWRRTGKDLPWTDF